MNDDFTTLTALMNEKARGDDIDRYNRAMSGLETGDGSAHDSLKEASELQSATAKREGRQDRKTSDALWRDLISRQIADLQTLIDGHEDMFAAQHGEAWREQLALAILAPDLIPQRREGESMEDYRERLEQALMDEFLNEDGTIKDKYKDHPQYGEYAKWAQWKYDQQQAQAFEAAMNDPSLSEAERAVLLDDYMQSPTYQRLNQKSVIEAGNEVSDAPGIAKERIEDTLSDVQSTVGEGGFKP